MVTQEAALHALSVACACCVQDVLICARRLLYGYSGGSIACSECCLRLLTF